MDKMGLAQFGRFTKHMFFAKGSCMKKTGCVTSTASLPKTVLFMEAPEVTLQRGRSGNFRGVLFLPGVGKVRIFVEGFRAGVHTSRGNTEFVGRVSRMSRFRGSYRATLTA